MSNEQKLTEKVLKEALEKIVVNKAIFMVMSKQCQNHVSVGKGCGRCTRRYNKNKGAIKFCEVIWCPLADEV